LRVLLISKIAGVFGAALFFLPGATLFVLHLLWSHIPNDLPFMDRMLVSVGGMGIALIGFIPTMVCYYRDGTTSISDSDRKHGL
jgi:hypothetical protein